MGSKGPFSPFSICECVSVSPVGIIFYPMPFAFRVCGLEIVLNTVFNKGDVELGILFWYR